MNWIASASIRFSWECGVGYKARQKDFAMFGQYW